MRSCNRERGASAGAALLCGAPARPAVDALFDVFPFLLFALFVLARLVRASRSRPDAGPTASTDSSGSGFDLNALLRALDEASNPETAAAPPPLPAVPPPVVPTRSVGFDPSHFTEDDPFTEPGIFREVHLARKPHAPAPGARGASRTGALSADAMRTRLRDPAALREAVVLQTILERRRRR